MCFFFVYCSTSTPFRSLDKYGSNVSVQIGAKPKTTQCEESTVSIDTRTMQLGFYGAIVNRRKAKLGQFIVSHKIIKDCF